MSTYFAAERFISTAQLVSTHFVICEIRRNLLQCTIPAACREGHVIPIGFEKGHSIAFAHWFAASFGWNLRIAAHQVHIYF